MIMFCALIFILLVKITIYMTSNFNFVKFNFVWKVIFCNSLFLLWCMNDYSVKLSIFIYIGMITIPANSPSGVRPMVKVQIPGSTGSITLRPATSTVTLAPKPSPGASTQSPPGGQTLTAIKLASVATPTPAQPTIIKGKLFSYSYLIWLFYALFQTMVQSFSKCPITFSKYFYQ